MILIHFQHERLSKIAATRKQKQSLEQGSMQVATPTRSSYDLSLAPLNRCVGSSSRCPSTLDENMLHQRVNNINRTQMEKAIMLKAGLDAKEELLDLLSTNEPLWVNSQGDDRLILHDRNY